MEVERMNGRVVVESGMGQLQVAVAGLGEGACGRACGQARAPGTRAPGRLGTLALCGAARTSAGGSRRRCHSGLASYLP